MPFKHRMKRNSKPFCFFSRASVDRKISGCHKGAGSNGGGAAASAASAAAAAAASASAASASAASAAAASAASDAAASAAAAATRHYVKRDDVTGVSAIMCCSDGWLTCGLDGYDDCCVVLCVSHAHAHA